jgi:hypothetical protein
MSGSSLSHVPGGIAERELRLLQPEEILVDHRQQVFAIEALARLQGLRIHRAQLVALIVQPGNFAPDAVVADIRQLSVELVAAGPRREERLVLKITFDEPRRELVPLPDWRETDLWA